MLLHAVLQQALTVLDASADNATLHEWKLFLLAASVHMLISSLNTKTVKFCYTIEAIMASAWMFIKLFPSFNQCTNWIVVVEIFAV